MIINLKKYSVLFCIIFLFFEAMLFPEEQAKSNINLGATADNAQYENAAGFYRLKEYSKALELFTEYLETNLNGLHRKEAYKNIAAIYFDRFDYIKSVKVYKSLYEEFSNSEEGIEGLFMAGICYQKMGFMDKAKETFKLLIEQHPSSNFAYQSRVKLDLIEILEKG